MVFGSNETELRFEESAAAPARNEQRPVRRWQGNPLAYAGAVLSFVPPVGLVLSALGFRRSGARQGLGRTAAQVGIALSLVFGGVEAYLGATAPMLDSGCLDADSPAAQLKALQASPGADLTAIAKKLDSIHLALAGAAANADSSETRVKLQLVSEDVKALSHDFTVARASGDTSALVSDQVKLLTDGNAADSYCNSL
jgi:hypothetical protein